MLKVLLTGANGLLGSKIISYIEHNPQLEVQLLATSKGAFRVDAPSINYVDLDVTHLEALKTTVETFKPNCIIHTAAMTNVDACETQHKLCEQLNVTSVDYLTQLCELHNIHLIHLSTDFIFDGQKNQPYLETDLPNPLSNYGWSKLKAEQLLLKASHPVSILRTAIVYGYAPHLTRNNIVLWVKKSLEQGQSITVVDDQYRNPTFAEDLAKACMDVALQKATGIYNVVGSTYLNMLDLAYEIAQFWNLEARLITAIKTPQLNQAAMRPPKTELSIEKAQHTWGYQPLSLQETFQELEQQL